MKIHEQRDVLAQAVELVAKSLPSGPTLGAFGIAREDCALVHIDYCGGIHSAQFHLLDALAEIRGTDAASLYRELGLSTAPCDCKSCVGEEAAAAAREKHRAAYTKVKGWAA